MFTAGDEVYCSSMEGNALIFGVFASCQFLILPAFYICATYSMLGGYHTHLNPTYMVNAIEVCPLALTSMSSTSAGFLLSCLFLQPMEAWVPAAGAALLWVFLLVWVVIHHRQAGSTCMSSASHAACCEPYGRRRSMNHKCCRSFSPGIRMWDGCIM